MNDVQQIAIDKIIVDQENHRRRNDDQAIESLKESIGAEGLLQPIGVTQDLHLIYGHRRLEAAKRLNWEEVPVIVHTINSDVTVHSLRLAENLERANLTPMEEAIGVSLLVGKIAAQYPSNSEAEVIEHAANELGRPVTWVRDRAYLARLTGKSMQALLDGKITLGEARELAKLADEKERDRIVTDVVRYGGDSPSHRLGLIRNSVTRNSRTLRGVPWLTDVEFAGAGSCDGCPSNSLNDVALFEHDPEAKATEAATCLNPSCYRKKETTVTLSIDKALAKVHKRVETEGLDTITMTTVGDLKPVAARPTTFINRARKLLDTGVAKPAKAVKNSGGSSPVAKERWRDEYERAYDHWVQEREKATLKALDDHPVGWAAVALVAQCEETRSWSSSIDLKKWEPWGALRDILSGNMSGWAVNLAKLAAHARGNGGRWSAITDCLFELDDNLREGIEQELLKRANLPPKPQEEDFKPKPKAEAAEASPAKKRSGKKASGKKKTSKKGGRKAVAS